MSVMHLMQSGVAVLVVSGVVAIAASERTETNDPPVTFSKDVLPILQKNCQSCHRPGQVAPMSLLTYEDARPWARAIKLKTMSREMPPWFADPRYGEFANARRLSESEIDTIAKWVDGGAEPGDPADAPPPVEWPGDGWEIEPDIIVNGPEFPVPAQGWVEWTYVTIPGGFTKDTWVTSIEVRPSEPSVTHHICVSITPHAPDVKYNVPEWEQKTRDESGSEPPKPKGFVTRRTLSRWTQAAKMNGNEACFVPGVSAADFRPFNAAKLIPAGSDIVFTLHYTPKGKAVVDRPRIGFTLAKEPPKRRYVMYNTHPRRDAEVFRIPPYEPNWQAPYSKSLFTKDAELVWLMPHMHLRGKDMTYRLDYPDGRSEIVLSVPRYDFNWQLGYVLAKPIRVPKGTTLHVEAHYDNSPGNRFNPDPSKTVYWGDQNWEEMMSPFFGVVLDMSIDPKKVIKPVGGTLASGG
jgi:hypothetical protein